MDRCFGVPQPLARAGSLIVAPDPASSTALPFPFAHACGFRCGDYAGPPGAIMSAPLAVSSGSKELLMTGLDISSCLGRTRYTAKDAEKAACATKYIGRGSARSSTEAYRCAIGPKYANTGRYTRDDIVWLSIEGARNCRVDHDKREISLAASAGVTFITDTRDHRERPYNVGERAVASFLRQLGYSETAPGRWQPRPA